MCMDKPCVGKIMKGVALGNAFFIEKIRDWVKSVILDYLLYM